MKNCLLIGVGGQGTILASKLIAQAAMDKGLHALTTETIGMAQRGGSVVSHVRIGKGIYSPLIPYRTADLIIGFEPAEAVRALPFLKDNGMLIVSSKAVMPVTSALSGNTYDSREMLAFLKDKVKNLVIIDTEDICNQCGSSKVANVALLGAAGEAKVLDITRKDFEDTINRLLPGKFIEMNLKALNLGAAGGKNK